MGTLRLVKRSIKERNVQKILENMQALNTVETDFTFMYELFPQRLRQNLRKC